MRSGYVVEGDLGSMLGELCGLHFEVIASQGFPRGFWEFLPGLLLLRKGQLHARDQTDRWGRCGSTALLVRPGNQKSKRC